MYAMLVIVLFGAAATSSVIYFPSQATCQRAQTTVTTGLKGLPVGAYFQVTCMPVSEAAAGPEPEKKLEKF